MALLEERTDTLAPIREKLESLTHAIVNRER